MRRVSHIIEGAADIIISNVIGVVIERLMRVLDDVSAIAEV